MPETWSLPMHVEFGCAHAMPHLMLCAAAAAGYPEIISSRIVEDGQPVGGQPPDDELPGLSRDPTEPVDIGSFVVEGGEPVDEFSILELVEKFLDARGYRLVGGWRRWPDGEVFHGCVARKGQVVDDTLHPFTILGDPQGAPGWGDPEAALGWGDPEGAPRWCHTLLYRVGENEIAALVTARRFPARAADGCPFVPYSAGLERSPDWQQVEEESDRFLAARGYRRVGPWAPPSIGLSMARFVQRTDAG